MRAFSSVQAFDLDKREGDLLECLYKCIYEQKQNPPWKRWVPYLLDNLRELLGFK
jgi:hypothetical protein